MHVKRHSSHVLTGKESVGCDVVFVVAVVAASVALRRVAHAATDTVLVRLRVFAAAVLAVAGEFADKNSFLFTHRHCVYPLPTESANRFFRSPVPKMAVFAPVTLATKLAKLNEFSCREPLSFLIAFETFRSGSGGEPGAPAASSAAKLPLLSLGLVSTVWHSYRLQKKQSLLTTNTARILYAHVGQIGGGNPGRILLMFIHENYYYYIHSCTKQDMVAMTIILFTQR